jgi:hypothetical protein
MEHALLFSGLFAVSLPMYAVDGIARTSAKQAWPNLANSAQAMQLATARHLAALVGGRMARIAGTGSMEPQLTGWDLAIFAAPLAELRVMSQRCHVTNGSCWAGITI